MKEKNLPVCLPNGTEFSFCRPWYDKFLHSLASLFCAKHPELHLKPVSAWNQVVIRAKAWKPRYGCAAWPGGSKSTPIDMQRMLNLEHIPVAWHLYSVQSQVEMNYSPHHFLSIGLPGHKIAQGKVAITTLFGST